MKKSPNDFSHPFLFSTVFVVALSLLLMSSSGCESTGWRRREPAKVEIATKFGNMVVQLSDSTPQHRDNFLKLVDDQFYDSLIFHRVILRVHGAGRRSSEQGRRCERTPRQRRPGLHGRSGNQARLAPRQRCALSSAAGRQCESRTPQLRKSILPCSRTSIQRERIETESKVASPPSPTNTAMGWRT